VRKIIVSSCFSDKKTINRAVIWQRIRIKLKDVPHSTNYRIFTSRISCAEMISWQQTNFKENNHNSLYKTNKKSTNRRHIKNHFNKNNLQFYQNTLQKKTKGHTQRSTILNLAIYVLIMQKIFQDTSSKKL